MSFLDENLNFSKFHLKFKQWQCVRAVTTEGPAIVEQYCSK